MLARSGALLELVDIGSDHVFFDCAICHAKSMMAYSCHDGKLVDKFSVNTRDSKDKNGKRRGGL